MECVICENGETIWGETAVTLGKGDCRTLFHHIPALICNSCGEVYVAEAVTQKLLGLMKTVERGEADIRNNRFCPQDVVFEELEKMV